VKTERKKAYKRTIDGGGTTLIEDEKSHYGAKTNENDPTKYRDQKAENEKRRRHDPITRLELFMKENGFWEDTWAEEIEEEIKEEIDGAVKDLESMPPANVCDMYDYMFEEPTWTIEQQKEAYMNYLRGDM